MRFVDEILVPGRDPEEVFAYVSDFDRAHEWRDEVVESTMTPAGPMGVGTRLVEVALVAGRRVVTESVVDEYTASPRATAQRWHFSHESGPLPVSGDLTVAGTEGGTLVSYTLDVDLPGGWALAAPYLRWSGRRTIRRSMEGLRRILSAEVVR